MLLKITLLVLFVAMIASLFSGLGFLLKDHDQAGSKRVLYALGIRVSLAACLLLTIFYGLSSGELQLGAPWHNKP